MKNIKLVIALLIIVVIVAGILIFQVKIPTTGKFTGKTSIANVSKVVDGDTVSLQSGEKVRLLGINTPEKGQSYYSEASNKLKELVEGKTVVLESDTEDKDQHGRLLRYIYVNSKFVNLELVREGYAHVYIVMPNNKYENDLKQAELHAKNAKLRIWASGEGACDKNCINIFYFHWDAEGKDCENLNDEYVTFVNNCSFDCDLTGWTVKDEATTIYTFPSFVLSADSKVTLYTGCGNNTKTELYWCNHGKTCNAIWNNDGDTLYLRN
jgi:micrococcal nuclease